MTRLKVNLNSGNHSTGRGVGFYAANLEKALSRVKTIELTNKDPKLIHYPFFDLFYPTLPLIKNKPTVVTIHDLTPLVLKDKYPKGIRGFINLARQRLSLANVSAIITDSLSSKQDIIKIFKINPQKIHVVYLDCDPLFKTKVSNTHRTKVKQKYDLPDKFILGGTGHPNPNKNLPLLAQVTSELKIPLVLFGKGMTQNISHPVHFELKDLHQLQKFKHIIYPGFVPTSDLVAMLNLSKLYCLPSLYEGFGITLLEAMSTGTLLVSSNSSSLPELYGNAAITFNPTSKTSLKKALIKGLNLTPTQKQNLISKGYSQVKKFSWNKTATQTSQIYHSIATNHR